MSKFESSSCMRGTMNVDQNPKQVAKVQASNEIYLEKNISFWCWTRHKHWIYQGQSHNKDLYAEETRPSILLHETKGYFGWYLYSTFGHLGFFYRCWAWVTAEKSHSILKGEEGELFEVTMSQQGYLFEERKSRGGCC